MTNDDGELNELSKSVLNNKILHDIAYDAAEFAKETDEFFMKHVQVVVPNIYFPFGVDIPWLNFGAYMADNGMCEIHKDVNSEINVICLFKDMWTKGGNTRFHDRSNVCRKKKRNFIYFFL